MSIKVGDTIDTPSGRARVVECDGIVAVIEYSDGMLNIIDTQSVKMVRDNIIRLKWGENNGKA